MTRVLSFSSGKSDNESSCDESCNNESAKTGLILSLSLMVDSSGDTYRAIGGLLFIQFCTLELTCTSGKKRELQIMLKLRNMLPRWLWYYQSIYLRL